MIDPEAVPHVMPGEGPASTTFLRTTGKVVHDITHRNHRAATPRESMFSPPGIMRVPSTASDRPRHNTHHQFLCSAPRFSVRLKAPFLRPGLKLPQAPRTAAVKDGRRPPRSGAQRPVACPRACPGGRRARCHAQPGRAQKTPTAAPPRSLHATPNSEEPKRITHSGIAWMNGWSPASEHGTCG